MLAVSRGYVDIVYGLHTCPLIDINHQDNEGSTAVMIAAQAGKHRDIMMAILGEQEVAWLYHIISTFNMAYDRVVKSIIIREVSGK